MLDELPADHPEAIRSRRDLVRVNRLMGTAGLLLQALDPLFAVAARGAPLHLVELGAGDGRVMQQLARRRGRNGPAVQVTLLDRQPVIATETLTAIAESGWHVRVEAADVFDWLERAPPRDNTVVMANLFLHHFQNTELERLFAGLAQCAQAVIALEPRRARLPLLGSHLLGFVGCNAVTRHDAVVSVHAGFRGQELSALWPPSIRASGHWGLSETEAGLFSQRLVAIRNAR